MNIGIIREGKVPPDFRVALTPKQCRHIQETYPEVRISVQKSDIRTYLDEEYSNVGFDLVDTLDHCDWNIEVKVRSTQPAIPALVIPLTETDANIVLSCDELGISPGQACVFYEVGTSRVLGGGWITN